MRSNSQRNQGETTPSDNVRKLDINIYTILEDQNENGTSVKDDDSDVKKVLRNTGTPTLEDSSL